MKRIIILLCTALIALFLVSCSMQSSGINQGDEKKRSENSGISLVERAYSYGDISLPNTSSNPNNNVH